MLRRLLFPLAALALAGFLLERAWNRPPVAAGSEESAFHMVFPVGVVPVEAAEVVESIEVVGEVAAARRSVLAFERAGTLAALEVELGDPVRTGQVLARLDNAVLAEEVAAAEAAVALARSDAALARREAERARSLSDRELSATDRDRLESAAEAAELRLARDEADLRRLRVLLRKGQLEAPFDGVVVSRPVAPGTFLAAGQVCLEVLEQGHRELRLEIPAAAAARVHAGASVLLGADELPGEEFAARLDRLLPQASPDSRMVLGIVRLDEQGVDPEGRLLPGFFLRGRLELRRLQAPAVVPRAAVLPDARGPYLYLVSEEGEGPPRAQPVPVRIRAREGQRLAVESLVPGALETGDRVCVTGAGKLFPGAPLRPVPEGGPPAAGGAASPGHAEASPASAESGPEGR